MNVKFSPPRSNALLTALPDNEFLLMSNHLERVSLSKGQTLFTMGQRPSHAYYPVDTLVSMMLDSPEGNSIETNVLGNTCVVGIGTVYSPSFYRATVRKSGDAYRMSMAALKKVKPICPSYMRHEELATTRKLAHMAQKILCVAHHSKEKQIIMWLLLTLDRSYESVINITQQEMADLLGLRREVISRVLNQMVCQGELKLDRGSITVNKRSTLEKRACNCYELSLEKQYQHTQ